MRESERERERERESVRGVNIKFIRFKHDSAMLLHRSVLVLAEDSMMYTSNKNIYYAGKIYLKTKTKTDFCPEDFRERERVSERLSERELRERERVRE